MNYISILAFLLLSTQLSAQVDLKDYYFPMPDEEYSKVYMYAFPDEPDLVLYWRITYKPESSELVTKGFNHLFLPVDEMVEKITTEGSILTVYTEWEDPALPTERILKGEIKEADVLKWNSKDEYQYVVVTPSKYGPLELTRTREFLEFETVDWNGTVTEAAKFKGTYTFKLEGDSRSYTMSQFTYYAKGVGMIRNQRTIQGETRTLELVKVMSLEEFKALEAGE